MSDDEDDKPTVVLDINALKAELDKKKEEMEDIAQDLSFAVEESIEEEIAQVNNTVDDKEYILFDLNSEFFQKNKSKLPGDFNYVVVNELKELNSKMQSGEDKVVIFNYNAAPKAVNQLTIQIKAKFPKVKTVIMAKNLSDEKALAHKKTKSGAHAYISVPFKNENMVEILKKV
jgi:DNA-binding NtrC family response regulator